MHCFSNVRALLYACMRYLAHSNVCIVMGATQRFALSWILGSMCGFLPSFMCQRSFTFTSPVGAGRMGRSLATLVTGTIVGDQTQRRMLTPSSAFYREMSQSLIPYDVSLVDAGISCRTQCMSFLPPMNSSAAHSKGKSCYGTVSE